MERNTFRKIATVAALVLGLIPGLAASAHAQFTRQAGFTIFLPSPNDLVEITAGGSHTCVRKYDGRIYCWGLNGWWSSTDGGQVGVISTNTCYDKPIQDPMNISIAPATSRPCVDRPQQVPFAAASQVVAGFNHTCALSNGTASCWGTNATYGALGDGGTTDRYSPSPVAIPVGGTGTLQFSSLSAGDGIVSTT